MALSRAVLTDMIFSVIVAASLGFFYKAYTQEKHRQSGIIWGFVLSAIAVLTKGLLGICFPMAAISIFSIYYVVLANEGRIYLLFTVMASLFFLVLIYLNNINALKFVKLYTFSILRL